MRKQISKLVNHGGYVAEVDVELLYTDDEWSPYSSVEDATKLDEVREAPRRKDFTTAQKLARVYRLLHWPRDFPKYEDPRPARSCSIC